MSKEIDLGKEFPLEAQVIESILPHRYPMLLIDRMLSMEGGTVSSRVGRKAHGIKNISMNEEIFKGHFPGNPIYPGVLMIESLAQTAALSAYIPGADVDRFYIAAINNAKFRAPVIPGDTIHLHTECLKDRGSIVIFHAQAKVENKVVAEAELWAKIF